MTHGVEQPNTFGDLLRLSEPANAHDTGPALPVWLTSFVGRERDLAEVLGLLGTVRLLTLTGPGGIGKTRLAVAAAASDAAAFPDGVVAVELAALADPIMVPLVVASALRVSQEPGRPVLEALQTSLRPKELLLVLDNCEHLVAECANLVDALLRACPKLRVLATSRERLGVAGETVWQVPPLEKVKAAQLFVDRARSALPGFSLSAADGEAVLEVCRRLDGIPLAVELAAARVTVLGPKQIAERLNDRFQLLTDGTRTALARHQTLRAALEWSYGLLTEPERLLFERLSVFAGGWTLDPAESVCSGGSIDRNGILDLLGHLVAKSLVVVEHDRGVARYRYLETLRQYASECLVEHGDVSDARRRHAAYFLRLAKWADREILGPHPVEAMDRLEREQDNLRAALRWLVDCGTAEEACQLGARLGNWWRFRGHHVEGRSWYEAMLNMPDAPTPATRADMLRAAVVLETFPSSGDLARAQALAEESLGIARALGDSAGSARSLTLLGVIAAAMEDHARARTMFEEAVSIAKVSGSALALGRALWALALADREQADYATAHAHLEHAIKAFATMNFARGTASALTAMASVAYRQADRNGARTLCQTALGRWQDLSDRWEVAQTLILLGMIEADDGNIAAASASLTQSIELLRGLGESPASALEGLAYLAAARGRADSALRIAGAAAHLRTANRGRPAPIEGPLLERRLARARGLLGGRAAVEWAAGQGLNDEEAVAQALRDLDMAASLIAPDHSEPPDRLTPRELDILRLIADGRDNGEIAEALALSVRTVERHVTNIYSKIGARGRAEATSYAFRRGMR